MAARTVEPESNAPAARPRGLHRAAWLPLAALVAANLVPLVGVIGFNWSLRGVLLLYWAENVVVAAYAIARMFMVGGFSAAPVSLFFSFHFGMFMFVHLVFLLAFSSDDFAGGGAGSHAAAPFTPGDVARSIPWLGVAALVISHGISFIREFWLAGEWRHTDVRTEMFRPYPRMAVMHIAIIAGGFFIAMLGQPAALLAVLIVLKILIDSAIHTRDHATRQAKHSLRQGAAKRD